jgi:hypothetical protein
MGRLTAKISLPQASRLSSKIRIMRLLFVLLSALLLVPSASAADQASRDGNWWNSQTELFKDVYVVGFFDGLLLGKNFSYWTGVKDGTKEVWVDKAAESWHTYYQRYITRTTSRQIADGLNALYTDFKNRSIPVEDGVWVVLRQIAGDPSAEIDQLIQNYRKNARPR